MVNQLCEFFSQGLCNRGEYCRYIHAGPSAKENLPQHGALRTGTVLDAKRDTRGQVRCRFIPYLHDAVTNATAGAERDEDHEASNDSHDLEDDLSRVYAGASVYFNDSGQVIKITLPTDFSTACITSIELGTTPGKLAGVLMALGFDIPIESIRMTAQTSFSTEAKAMITMEDPLFSTRLASSLRSSDLLLSATTVPINATNSNCRKVHLSWHKSSRNVWLNFGDGDIAKRVSHRFNAMQYKILGQTLAASAPKHGDSVGGRGRGRNHVPWTVVLSGVPPPATKIDIEKAIVGPYDKPRHIEMGLVSYQASDSEVSKGVRSKLETFGALDDFSLTSSTKGKRTKAVAWFEDEGAAKLACSLDNMPLPILNGGKLTVTLIQSAKVKVLATIYSILETKIGQEAQKWKKKHLHFYIYPDTQNRFTTLKIQGQDFGAVAMARKTLENILAGRVLTTAGNPIWSPELNRYGTALQAIKAIEKDLSVVIIRDKTKRHLVYYGAPENFDQAASRVTDIFKHDTSADTEIDLTAEQLSWAITGGFKTIQQTIGTTIPTFNIVTRKISINGTQQHYRTALGLVRQTSTSQKSTEGIITPNGDCPICLCEAENPVHTRCQHTYCLDCFEENCKAAPSNSGANFQIKCQGDEGTCSCIFNMEEISTLLSSSALESILQESFKEYIRRHPETFHYCPTVDCGHIYRCSRESNPKPQTCSNCLESICTTCRALHGKYSCADYREIVSGGYEALIKLKKELNIKDCPRCSTPMEKTDGCNHMTCAGCKAHICWVCMAVFEASGPCYAHLSKVHGGIGLGLERFMEDW